MSVSRAYNRPVFDRARQPFTPEWVARVGVAIAVFLAFLGLGRVTASPGAAGEASAPTAVAIPVADLAVPAHLAGFSPLEALLGEAERRERAARAARARAGAASPRARATQAQARARERTRAAAPVTLVPQIAPAPAPASSRSVPIAPKPAPAKPAPARRTTSGAPSAGTSFDSSG